MGERETVANVCTVITTPAAPPHVREVRCGRKLDAQGWCPKHDYQAPEHSDEHPVMVHVDGCVDCQTNLRRATLGLEPGRCEGLAALLDAESNGSSAPQP